MNTTAWRRQGARRIWTRRTLTTHRRVWWCNDSRCWLWRTTRPNGEILRTDAADTMWLAMEAADKIGVTLDPPGGVDYPEEK